jgi:AraC-like DNA-binding protein
MCGYAIAPHPNLKHPLSAIAPPLFDAACRLTGGSNSFVIGLESLAHNYRFSFPNLLDVIPLTRGPVKHRSTGWMVGDVGVGIGEHTPVQASVAGVNGLLLYAPTSGRLKVKQDGQLYRAPANQGWMLFADRPAVAQTGTNSSIVMALKKPRLQATISTMLGEPGPLVGERTQALSLSSLAGQQAKASLPVLLHHTAETTLHWPTGVAFAEDVLYRFVANLLISDQAQSGSVLRRAADRQTLDLACAYMLSQIDRGVSMTEVENVAKVGTRSLQLAFMRRFGVTPMAWLKEQRLQLAYRLVTTHPDAPVSWAAGASGLNHFGRFSQAFQARFGVAPSDLAHAIGRAH